MAKTMLKGAFWNNVNVAPRKRSSAPMGTNLGSKLRQHNDVAKAERVVALFAWLRDLNACWDANHVEWEATALRIARRVARMERDKAIWEMLKLRRQHKAGAPVAREYFMEQVINLRALERKAS